jgi:hypothetical protein
MAQGRSRAERERLFHEGRCMGSRCRQEVKNGDGNQFLELAGSFARLCERCASKRMQVVGRGEQAVPARG